MYEVVIITLSIISIVMAFLLGFLTSPGEESIATHKSYIKGYDVGYKKGFKDGRRQAIQIEIVDSNEQEEKE